jgi:integrase
MAQYKGFFSFCRNRGFIPLGFEPMHGWRSLTSGTPREHQRIPVEKWGELLDECVHPTERALVALGLYLFLRSSEIQQLRVSSVDLESNTIEIRRVKTRDWDIMPICLELAVELREYLDWYSSQNGYSPDAFLIPARGTDLARDPDTNRLLSGTGSIETSRPIGRPHVTVQRILTSANLPTSDEGMHSLRRAGSRALFDSLVTSGYDGALKRVQSMLGHRSAKVTETYLGLDVDRRSRNQALASAPMFPPRVISPERQAS